MMLKERKPVHYSIDNDIRALIDALDDAREDIEFREENLPIAVEAVTNARFVFQPGPPAGNHPGWGHIHCNNNLQEATRGTAKMLPVYRKVTEVEVCCPPNNDSLEYILNPCSYTLKYNQASGPQSDLQKHASEFKWAMGLASYDLLRNTIGNLVFEDLVQNMIDNGIPVPRDFFARVYVETINGHSVSLEMFETTRPELYQRITELIRIHNEL